jgi:hypothetical protein
LPQPIPFANVFSIGDVLIGLGGALWLIRVMQGGTAPLPRARTIAAPGMQRANG